MYSAVNRVKMYACNAATNSSKMEMKSVNKTDAGPTHAVSKMNTRETRLNTMMCPAVMFANKRIIKEKGLVKIPINSTNDRSGLTHPGMPGIQKICCQ